MYELVRHNAELILFPGHMCLFINHPSLKFLLESPCKADHGVCATDAGPRRCHAPQSCSATTTRGRFRVYRRVESTVPDVFGDEHSGNAGKDSGIQWPIGGNRGTWMFCFSNFSKQSCFSTLAVFELPFDLNQFVLKLNCLLEFRLFASGYSMRWTKASYSALVVS
jgi:hypothetical protein